MIEEAADCLIREDSKNVYNSTYKKFINWTEERKINIANVKTDNARIENILLEYLHYLSRYVVPPSLWSTYSMLKATLNIYNDIDISKYSNLKFLLKQKMKGYIPKVSSVFSNDELQRFYTQAPDDEWLVVKVGMIFGMCGACRRHELHNIKVNDVQEYDSSFLVQLGITEENDKKKKKSKNNEIRQFAVVGEFYRTVKKYIDLRPADYKSENFFMKYQNGQCSRANIGINTIGGWPKEIATFLKLPHPEKYTGHAFRRSSATTYVNSSADITNLKRLGDWQSTTVAEHYVAESDSRKRKVCQQIQDATLSTKTTTIEIKRQAVINEPLPSTSSYENASSSTRDSFSSNNGITLNITNCPNLQIIFNDDKIEIKETVIKSETCEI